MSLKPKTIDFDKTWDNIKDTMLNILTNNFDKIPTSVWNDRFTDIYELCVAHPDPYTNKLYDHTKDFIADYVNDLLENMTQGELEPQEFLRRYYQIWKEYSTGIGYLSNMFTFMNQQYVNKRRPVWISFCNSTSLEHSDDGEKLDIAELGLNIWQKYMLLPIKQQLVDDVLNCVFSDRRALPSVSDEIVHEVIDSFVKIDQFKKSQYRLDFYKEFIEDNFLRDCETYYKADAKYLVDSVPCVNDYLREVIAKMNLECDRCKKYFHTTTLVKLMDLFQARMVKDYADYLYNDVDTIVSSENHTDLKNMHQLLGKVDIDVMTNSFKTHVIKQGHERVSQLNNDANIHIDLIDCILEVYYKYRKMITIALTNDQHFCTALDKAMSVIVNNPSKKFLRSAEMLAKYCDALLKKKGGVNEVQEIDIKLSQLIMVFKYLDDKDVFQKFYSRLFAKRLIYQQSQSMDAEEAMINRLKNACGYEFTNKFHRMYTDINLCTDLNQKFNASHGDELLHNFHIYVLQEGAWPLQNTPNGSFTLPREIEHCVQIFEKFYHTNFNGRKLTWLYHLSQAELRFCYLKKSYLISMQTYQMALMLLFEKCDAICVRDMLESLQMTLEQLQRHVASLIECKLLLASDESITEETILSLNFEYTNKRTKFRVHVAQLPKESVEEIETTLNSVEEDRKCYLQAAIVRIMKGKKTLRHNDLVQEILKLNKIGFTPNISLIKKCIESLIEKQYIERTPESTDLYNYVA